MQKMTYEESFAHLQQVIVDWIEYDQKLIQNNPSISPEAKQFLQECYMLTKKSQLHTERSDDSEGKPTGPWAIWTADKSFWILAMKSDAVGMDWGMRFDTEEEAQKYLDDHWEHWENLRVNCIGLYLL